MSVPDFSKVSSVHFIGIGGIGTSAIARMFLLDGKKVSGSDIAESEVTEALKMLGAEIRIDSVIGKVEPPQEPPQQRLNLIPEGTELVIYTIAIPSDHPELLEAKKRGIPTLSYPEALGVISRGKYTIAITGTHGKTTTTAMVAKILMDAGMDPTVIVGSFLLDVPPLLSKEGQGSGSDPLSNLPFRKGGEERRTNFVAGKSKYLVVEGCEYRRSFLNLSPQILVITNIDADHLDYYRSIDGVENGFRDLAAKVPARGAAICDFSDARAKRAAAAGKGTLVNFGASLPRVSPLLVPGRHNRKNAAAALAVADFLGVDIGIAAQSLSEFRGTWRRFEYRGKVNPPAGGGALVYDDYGHHPTEIEATLSGARDLFPTQKIIVVFQPHLYSRTKEHLAGFGRCFARADAVILLPIYPAREPDTGDITSEMVVAEIKKRGQAASFAKDFADAAAQARSQAGEGDVIITLGAGETNKVADILVSSK